MQRRTKAFRARRIVQYRTVCRAGPARISTYVPVPVPTYPYQYLRTRTSTMRYPPANLGTSMLRRTKSSAFMVCTTLWRWKPHVAMLRDST